ncbi:hypothetical protein MRX96_021368 [Rhipicephalus microplus]
MSSSRKSIEPINSWLSERKAPWRMGFLFTPRQYAPRWSNAVVRKVSLRAFYVAVHIDGSSSTEQKPRKVMIRVTLQRRHDVGCRAVGVTLRYSAAHMWASSWRCTACRCTEHDARLRPLLAHFIIDDDVPHRQR